MSFREMKRLTLALLSFFFLSLSVPVYAAAVNQQPAIEGLSLEKVVKGRRVYSIEAKKASFGNKRIGFLNLAFIKVINLEDVYFTLYNESGIVKKQHFNNAVYEINAKRLLDERGNLIFSE